jgi:hypothetical protein
MIGRKVWLVGCGLVAAGLMLAPTTADAAKPKKKKAANTPEALFKKLDTNNDGSLSPDEFKKLGDVQQATKKKKKAAT